MSHARRGEVPLRGVVAAVEHAEQELVAVRSRPALSAEPDRAWVDGWLHRSYLSFWESR